MGKVLVIGPSGAGKTYLSKELKKLGLNAVDADSIDGLSSWHDGNGNKVQYPKDADKDFFANHSFLWDRKFLKNYLDRNPEVFLFGSSGNMFEMINLFDRVFFLKVAPELIGERLTHESRENPMGQTEFQRQNAINWGKEIKQKAKNLGLEFIDGTLSPEEIYKKLKA